MSGLKQSNTTLKEHVVQLEDALAGRESVLLEMQSKLEQVLREKDAENHESIKRVQILEESLQKEKDGQREVKKQVSISSSNENILTCTSESICR